MNVSTHYYHKFPKVDRTNLGNQEATQSAYMYALWEDRCVKGMLFHFYFKMYSFYECSLKRIFLVKRKKKIGKLPIGIKKFTMYLAISFLRHYFFNAFLLCDFASICVSL